jgi:hypothetical protein
MPLEFPVCAEDVIVCENEDNPLQLLCDKVEPEYLPNVLFFYFCGVDNKYTI